MYLLETAALIVAIEIAVLVVIEAAVLVVVVETAASVVVETAVPVVVVVLKLLIVSCVGGCDRCAFIVNNYVVDV